MTEVDQKYLTKLKPEDTVLVLVDFLTGFQPGIRTIDTPTYMNNVEALCRMGELFNLPVIVLGDEGGFRGSFLPPVRKYLPDARRVERHTPSAWNMPEYRQALEEIGRQRVIFGGISLDNCVVLNALDLLANGYDVHVVVDASGTTMPLVEQAAMMRLTQAGAVMTSWVQLASELMDDWNTPEGPKVGALYNDLSKWGPDVDPAGQPHDWPVALSVAYRAFEGFTQTFKTGDPTSFLDVLTDDVTFKVALPVEGWQEQQQGKQRVRDFFDFELNTANERLSFEPISATAEGSEAVIRCTESGTIDGEDYENTMVFVFETEGDLVHRWSAFLGGMNPAAAQGVAASAASNSEER